MCALAEAARLLRLIPNLSLFLNEPIAPYTRFAIGGPAAVFCEATLESSFADALAICNRLAVPTLVIGGGSNLIVSDKGYPGVVLRFTGAVIHAAGLTMNVEAGAELQAVVDRSIVLGLRGLETMTGIPGYLGGAVYGNAGAYGHSMQEIVKSVRFTDGKTIHQFSNEQCRFRYRESIFKARKDWIVMSAELAMTTADSDELAGIASEIRKVRDAKYPPDMKCAGSVFKNLFLADLPAAVQAQVPAALVREGKVPSAWFLEQAGVKGMRRGDIQVAEYHANLIYNDGNGTAADLVQVIQEVKDRVQERFGFALEEEVQYVGFSETL